MKKVASLILALVVVFSIAACDNKDKPEETSAASESAVVTDAGETDPAESSADDPDAELTPVSDCNAAQMVNDSFEKLCAAESVDMETVEKYSIKTGAATVTSMASSQIKISGTTADDLTVRIISTEEEATGKVVSDMFIKDCCLYVYEEGLGGYKCPIDKENVEEHTIRNTVGVADAEALAEILSTAEAFNDKDGNFVFKAVPTVDQMIKLNGEGNEDDFESLFNPETIKSMNMIVTVSKDGDLKCLEIDIASEMYDVEMILNVNQIGNVTVEGPEGYESFQSLEDIDDEDVEIEGTVETEPAE